MPISLLATFKGKDDTYEKLKEAFKGALNEKGQEKNGELIFNTYLE